MISYEPFYKTLKAKSISTYKLINNFGISRSLLDRLKHNKPISTVTVNDLCRILNLGVADIIIYVTLILYSAKLTVLPVGITSKIKGFSHMS